MRRVQTKIFLFSRHFPCYNQVSVTTNVYSLHMSVIKDTLPVILPVLTELINRSLLTSVFSSAWKESVVIPILKEGDHEVTNNNRPVSLLPALSKICKRAALNQLTEYTTRQNCLTEHQNGNKKKHSTETLHISMSDLILEEMDRKQVTALVLLDLSKASDSQPSKFRPF